MFDGVLEQFGLRYEDYGDIIKDGSKDTLSDLDFIYQELQEWIKGPKRKYMVLADQYYNYDVEPEERKKLWGVGADGEPVWVAENAGKILDDVYALQVDKKVNYVVGKPIAYQTDNDQYTEWLAQIIDSNFMTLLNNVTTDAHNSGLSWVHSYYDENGVLNFRMFPALQIMPLWKDDEHTQLDMAVRYYLRNAYEGTTRKVIQHVDVYKVDGIYRYTMETGKLIADPEQPFLSYGVDGEGKSFTWGRVPLVAFKYNSREIPLLKRGKSMQDSINRVRSGWDQAMTESVRDNIMVVKNYGGENLDEFKKNVIRYGAVNVADNGGIDLLNVKRDATSYVDYLANTKRALVEAYRGFDAKDDRMGNNPNEMNLRSMYSDVDLDADMLEMQYQFAFDQLLWFVDEYLKRAGAGDYSKEKVVFTFNRNMIVNEADIINNVKNSQGLVSRETLLAHHPYVKDVQQELKQIEDEQSEQLQQFQTNEFDRSGDVDEES